MHNAYTGLESFELSRAEGAWNAHHSLSYRVLFLGRFRGTREHGWDARSIRQTRNRIRLREISRACVRPRDKAILVALGVDDLPVTARDAWRHRI